MATCKRCGKGGSHVLLNKDRICLSCEENIIWEKQQRVTKETKPETGKRIPADGLVEAKEEQTKKCPFCAEIIKREAIVCRFCGRELAHNSSAQVGGDIREDNSMTNQEPERVVVTPTKSVGISILLTVLFGPLGMLYSTIWGAIIMIVVSVVVGVVTLGFGAFVTWPICILWAALATSSYNRNLLAGKRKY